MNLNEYFAAHTPNIIAEMKSFFAERRAAARPLSDELVQSIDVIEEFSLRGGKMVRSSLVLLAYELAGGTLSPAMYQVAAGIELFHKHILNLDDMADRDEVRYGGPTVWKKYQTIFKDWTDHEHHARTFAEIDGTLLGSFAFELVRRAAITDTQKLAIMDVLNNHMYFETVAGWEIHYYQNHQLLAEAQEDQFMKGLDLVTSRYTFVGPLKIGLILADQAQSSLTDKVEKYGLAVGLAFQLTDDVLGVFGDPAETGKAVGNDIREGKKTVLLQRAYHSSNDADQRFLADVCGRDLLDGELARVQEIMKSTGSLQYSETLTNQKISEAVSLLKSIELPPSDSSATMSDTMSQARDVLLQLALFVPNRKK